MTTLLMQGMRRSGTTIVYDLLSRDPRWNMYYEPLSKGRPGAKGGGSGLQANDLMDKVRDFRQQFCAKNGLPVDDEAFNQGAPSQPANEVTSSMPGFVVDYLQAMIQHQPPTAIKFTRMYCRVGILAQIAPDALFAVLLRDPKAVVCSYMFGKSRVRAHLFPDADAFFTRRSQLNAWNSRRIAEAAASLTGADIGDLTDVERILWLWTFKVGRTLAGAKQYFADQHVLLRHEALCDDPGSVMTNLYSRLAMPIDQGVIDFAVQHVRPNSVPDFCDDPRWQQALQRVGAIELMQQAGYL